MFQNLLYVDNLQDLLFVFVSLHSQSEHHSCFDNEIFWTKETAIKKKKKKVKNIYITTPLTAFIEFFNSALGNASVKLTGESSPHHSPGLTYTVEF